MSVPVELAQAARSWIDADPDPATAAELEAILAAGDAAELRDRMSPLAFGTAGLRGAVGAGSGRMNLAVVLRTAYGIARYIDARRSGSVTPLIVIGFDARPSSRGFAEASAGVLLAAGLRVVAFVEPAATPLVAFVGRERGAATTVVVTASHNPRGDNGYKIYGANAVQIIAPVDVEIARQIMAAPPARAIQRAPIAFDAAPPHGLELLRAAEQSAYFDAISRALPRGAARRDLRIVYSALHGVGGVPMLRTLADAGFSCVDVVPEQAEPDGEFPTTPFPNPEEPAALDRALKRARGSAAELLLVSDPDADRLAAAARLGGALAVLDGNQVGALLADYCLSLARGPERPLIVGSVVSSPLVAELARAAGAHYERTHTGFKWLWNAVLALEAEGVGKPCFAFEEALGYSVFSGVRDKDGISAGRALAELSAGLAGRGQTLFDRLHELYATHGLWVSGARNVALTGEGSLSRVTHALDVLATQRTPQLLGLEVTCITDYRRGGADRRPWLGEAPLLELELEAGGSRLFIRPSGTEPKLKLYAHVRRATTLESDLGCALDEARRFASALLRELELSIHS